MSEELTPMTDAEVAAPKAALAASTRGSRYVGDGSPDPDVPYPPTVLTDAKICDRTIFNYPEQPTRPCLACNWEANARFACLAHNLLPRLLAEPRP